VVLSHPINFFCFDFTACGKSEGEYSTVGWHEQEDLECVIQYLANTGKVNKFAVWGRSMGAVTAIFYAQKDPRINCLILDSAFSKFKLLVKEIAKSKANIPGFLTSGALAFMKQTIKKKANFDLKELKPIKYVPNTKIPALFGAAKDDSFVSPQHTKDLYMSYGGHKQLLLFEGDHNSPRPLNWLLMAVDFLNQYLLGIKLENKDLLKPKDHFTPTQVLSDNTKEYLKDPNIIQKTNYTSPVKSTMNFTWITQTTSSPTKTNYKPNLQLNPVNSDPSKRDFVNNENLPNTPFLMKGISFDGRFSDLSTPTNKQGGNLYLPSTNDQQKNYQSLQGRATISYSTSGSSTQTSTPFKPGAINLNLGKIFGHPNRASEPSRQASLNTSVNYNLNTSITNTPNYDFKRSSTICIPNNTGGLSSRSSLTDVDSFVGSLPDLQKSSSLNTEKRPPVSTFHTESKYAAASKELAALFDLADSVLKKNTNSVLKESNKDQGCSNTKESNPVKSTDFTDKPDTPVLNSQKSVEFQEYSGNLNQSSTSVQLANLLNK